MACILWHINRPAVNRVNMVADLETDEEKPVTKANIQSMAMMVSDLKISLPDNLTIHANM